MDIVIGTLPTAQKAGQNSILPLPESFKWLGQLDAIALGTFFTELLEAVYQSQRTGDETVISKVIGSWEETVYLMHDPVLMESVQAYQTNPVANIPAEVALEKLGISTTGL